MTKSGAYQNIYLNYNTRKRGLAMDPMEQLNSLMSTLAIQLAEKTLEQLEESKEHEWINQQELMRREGISWQKVREWEDNGLQAFRKGKDKEYCVADISRYKHLMKE
ncbi:hypothetical protein [Streptococcus suis]|uniref:hypothetical protein n=1 Tax=Streptococcus suis TaxID=1307 RepID=UPI003908A66C